MVELKKAILPALGVATGLAVAHGLTHEITKERPISEQVTIAGAVVFVLSVAASLTIMTLLD